MSCVVVSLRMLRERPWGETGFVLLGVFLALWLFITGALAVVRGRTSLVSSTMDPAASSRADYAIAVDGLQARGLGIVYICVAVLLAVRILDRWC